MKITLITTQASYWGGSEVLWTQVAEYALSKGDQVQIVIYDQKGNLHPVLNELQAKVTSCILLRNFVHSAGSAVQKAAAAVKNKLSPENLDAISAFNPDCILVSQANNFDAAFHPLISSFLATFSKPFYLLSQFNVDHGGLSYGDMEKACNTFAKAKLIFFVSKRNKDTTERQIAQTVSNAKVIDNPLNLRDTSYVPYPESNVISFASVARFDVNFKGQDILLQILSGNEWKAREWKLNFYGSGDDEKYLKKLTAFYELNDKVEFKGQVSDVREIWKNNHALLMPSIAEGKPLALEEAMVCGRVSVVSDVAGNAELVDDGVNGYIASSFLPGPFSKALERAWAERSQWQHKGKLAHEKMLHTLDFSPHITIYNTITK